MNEALEHHEHAEHAASSGNKKAALLIAILAALLAVTEQQAQHASIRVSADGIQAADAWAQYQGKSTRQTTAEDLSRLLQVLEPAGDPAVTEKRVALAKQFHDDAQRFDHDPRDGKKAIAGRAKTFEAARDHALEQSHSFDNAAAALQLGIVLATASVITGSTLLVRFGLAMGVLGLVLCVFGLVAPELGAF